MKMLKILLVIFCILGCFSWPSMQSDLEMYIVQVESPESQISTQLSRIDSENWYKSFFPNTIATAGSEEEPWLIYSYHNVMKGFAARLSVALDHMGVPREQVGYPDTRQDEDRSSCELRGKNVIPYTHMNVVAVLPSVGVHDSSFCDTFNIVRSHEDQTLVVGTPALVNPLDDKVDSPRENDLCPSGASTYNLTKKTRVVIVFVKMVLIVVLWLPVMVFHDIFNSDKKGLLNFEDDTLGESENSRDLSPWLRLPFDPGLDSRSNPFQEGKDYTSQMATVIFEDMIGGYHLKAQDLVTPRAQEYARKTRFEHKQGRVWKISWSIEDLSTHGFGQHLMGHDSVIFIKGILVTSLGPNALHGHPTL
ncbi:hypothetical protein FXO38_11830 [Capsicum annuum]|nr:hypothetical protein FXO38_11830 [Capsicum annuum]